MTVTNQSIFEQLFGASSNSNPFGTYKSATWNDVWYDIELVGNETVCLPYGSIQGIREVVVKDTSTCTLYTTFGKYVCKGTKEEIKKLLFSKKDNK